MHTQKAKPDDLKFEVNVSCESVRLKQSNNEGIVTPSGISCLDSGLSKVYFIFQSKEKNPDYSLSAAASWQPCTHTAQPSEGVPAIHPLEPQPGQLIF